MSTEMRDTLRKLAGDHLRKEAGNEKSAGVLGTLGYLGSNVMNPDIYWPATHEEKDLTNSDIIRYLAGYGIGGAALGALGGGAIGDWTSKSMVGGGAVGGATGLALGALALNARTKRDIHEAESRGEKTDLPNWAAKSSWLWRGGETAAILGLTHPKVRSAGKTGINALRTPKATGQAIKEGAEEFVKGFKEGKFGNKIKSGRRAVESARRSKMTTADKLARRTKINQALKAAKDAKVLEKVWKAKGKWGLNPRSVTKGIGIYGLLTILDFLGNQAEYNAITHIQDKNKRKKKKD